MGGVVYGRLVARQVRSRFAEMSRGDIAALLRWFGDDAHFFYPGTHALGGEQHPKSQIEAWFARAWSLFDFDFDVHDVLVGGPPWRLRVATRFTVRVTAPDGRVFVNPGMQYGVIRRARVVEDRIYLDTQLIEEALAHVGA